MTPTTIGLQLADHLWQTSFFVLAAWLAVRLAGRERPALRSQIWFAAALKCAIPLSVVGWAIALTRTASTTTAVESVAMVQAVSHPFATQSAPIAFSQIAAGAWSVVGSVALVAWLAGAAALLSADLLASIRLRRDLRSTRPAISGREFAALVRTAGHPSSSRVRLRLSSMPLEPGVLGVYRPILLWPTAVTPLLSDEQLVGVMSHELAHVERRDNMTAFVQRIVQSVFWFYPPVWWIGRQMLLERERACDQHVLRRGVERHAYAAALLTVCRACVQAPNQVAGVLGSQLRARVEDIMRYETPAPLRGSMVLGLLLTAVCAVAAPIITSAFDNPLARSLPLQAGPKRVPSGYAPTPSWIAIEMTSPRYDGGGFATRVTNRGTKIINELSFAAVVERVGGAAPVQVLTSPTWSMALAPGQSRDITAEWLTTADLDRLIAAASPAHIQIFFTPDRVRYADGTAWEMPINTTARNHRAALGLDGSSLTFPPLEPAADVPRVLVASPTAAAPGGSLCRDEQRRAYSTGAILPIRGEAGKRARCLEGRWLEVDPRGEVIR